MTREQWDSMCTTIQKELKNLIDHELTYWDCYESIKELIRPTEFDT